MDTPLVSIVIPAYQCEATLGAAISSALTQTYPNVEVVVCIDGATDRTVDIATSHGDLVRVVHQENAGPSAARNTAIRAAHGQLIALLDSDDLLLPCFVERAVARWREAGGGRQFVACNAHVMSRHGMVGTVFRAPRDDLRRQRMFMLEGNIATIHALFPRAMWDELDGFATHLRAMEDWDFWARAVFSGWSLHFVVDPVAVYRHTPGSLSSDRDLMDGHHSRMLQHLLDTVGDSMTDEEKAFVELAMTHRSAPYSRDLAADALAAGDVAAAARLCREAAMVTPHDRKIRLKAELLNRVPATGHLYRWREARRLHRLER